MGVVYRAKTGKIIFHGDVHIEPLSWGRVIQTQIP